MRALEALDRREAEALWCEASGMTRADIIAAGGLEAVAAGAGSEIVSVFNDMAQRRLAGEPLQHILGRAGFWTLDLIADKRALAPRPDSETLIEAALALPQTRSNPGWPARILDLGTGSGCLLLALLSEFPQARGVGVDLSAQALEQARENAARNGLAARARWLQGDWFAPLGDEKPFHFIVSNPPYIATAAIEGLQREVRDHDPRLALDGGPDGLGCYRRLAGELAGWLAPGGAALFEIGFDQEHTVRAVFEASGWLVGPAIRDLAGHPRVLAVSAPSSADL